MASGIEPSIKELVACKPKSFAYFMWSAWTSYASIFFQFVDKLGILLILP